MLSMFSPCRIIQSIQVFADLVPLTNDTDEDPLPVDLVFRRENFAVLIKVRVPNSNGTIPGQLVQAGSGLNINSDIDFTQGQFLTSVASTYPNSITGSLASAFLSSTLFQVFENTSTQFNNFTRLVFVVYDVNSPLFQDVTLNGTAENGTRSVILSVLRSPQQGPAPVDLEEPVKFQFQANQVSNKHKTLLSHHLVTIYP